MLDVTRTPPGISLRCLKADVWRVSEGRINTVQVPVRVTKVALEHLALMAARNTTLRAQDRLVVAVQHFSVVRFLVAVAAVLCPGVELVSNHATERVTLTVGTSWSLQSRSRQLLQRYLRSWFEFSEAVQTREDWCVPVI